MIDFEKIWAKENVNFTKRILSQLEDDPHLPVILDLIDREVTNIWVVLAYLAKMIKPERYLELGVRRGFSMAIMGARRKNALLVGFDNFQANYSGTANGSPDFVRAELAKVGHKGEIEFVLGDCDETVAAYETDILFPIVLADAEHTANGVYRDIINCLRLVSPGGYLVVDDLHDKEVKKGWDRAVNAIDYWVWCKDRVGVISCH